MDRLIKNLLIIAIAVLVQEFTFAQQKPYDFKSIDKTINETIFVVTNDDAFLTGETLYYKLSCLDNTTKKLSTFSKVAYLEIIDSNKKTIAKQKLFLENGSGSSDIFLPTTLETGNYKIVGYTKWMLNKNDADYFVKDIKIINPYNKLDDKTTVLIDSLKTEENTFIKTNYLKLITNKKTYKQRELVTLNLENNNESNFADGNYSLSVRKINNLSIKNKIRSNISTNTSDVVFNNKNVIPEIRGEIISGKIISKSGRKTIDKNISLSIPGENYVFKISKTNSKGVFNFLLDKNSTNQNIIVQVIDQDKDDFTIELFENQSPDYTNLTFEKFTINVNTRNIIEEKAIANQIENAFYESKKDSIINNSKSDSFYKSSATEYILDNYTRFPTLKETIIEVVEGMYASSKNKIYNLYLRDFDLNNKLDIPALVIVDGLLIQDINDLLDHKAALFQKIDIIKGGYYFGPKLYNGLISFTTKDYQYENKLNGDFIIKPTILRPETVKKQYQPDYKLGNNLVRIPDFREQLLWLPNINFIENQKSISFYTSDVNGEFEIILEGFTNAGQEVFEREIIQVKNN